MSSVRTKAEQRNPVKPALYIYMTKQVTSKQNKHRTHHQNEISYIYN